MCCNQQFGLFVIGVNALSNEYCPDSSELKFVVNAQRISQAAA